MTDRQPRIPSENDPELDQTYREHNTGALDGIESEEDLRTPDSRKAEEARADIRDAMEQLADLQTAIDEGTARPDAAEIQHGLLATIFDAQSELDSLSPDDTVYEP
jgi:hypothetical protein